MNTLPGPDHAELTAYLIASGAWSDTGIVYGSRIWRHDSGTRAAIPAEGHYSGDDEILEILQQAALTIARTALGITDDQAGFNDAICRLAAAQTRITQLEMLVTDILSRFTATGDGRRASTGQVQIAQWHQTLNTGVPSRARSA